MAAVEGPLISVWEGVNSRIGSWSLEEVVGVSLNQPHADLLTFLLPPVEQAEGLKGLRERAVPRVAATPIGLVGAEAPKLVEALPAIRFS